MKRKTLVTLLSTVIPVVVIGVFLVFLQIRERVVMRSPLLTHRPSLITYIEGEAEMLPAGETEWISAAVGDKVRAGFRIRTGPDALMDIRLDAGSVVRMGENAVLVFDQMTLKSQEISLEQGRLFAKISRIFKDQRVDIRAPFTVAGVRGTELIFQVDGDGEEASTTVTSLSGITEVRNPDLEEGRVLLAYQNKTTVKNGAPPTEPTALSPVEIAAHRRVFNSLHAEIVLLVTYDIRFEADSATILEDSRKSLDRVYRLIDKSNYRVLIAGHTADIGKASGQYRLSVARAESIKGYLVEKGIREDRLRTAGYGGTRPVAPNDDDEGRALNRRVEFLIVE